MQFASQKITGLIVIAWKITKEIHIGIVDHMSVWEILIALTILHAEMRSVKIHVTVPEMLIAVPETTEATALAKLDLLETHM